MISRRQFLRACMYVAPAAIVAPKAISYFLPRVEAATPEEVNIVLYGADGSGAADIIELLKRRMNEAMNRMTDELAYNIYNSAPLVTNGFFARPGLRRNFDTHLA